MTDRNNTTASMVADLRALTEPSGQVRRALRTIPPRGPLEAQRGRGDYETKASGTGGGIASPLIEEDLSRREYFPEEYLKSTDGLMWSRARPLKKIVMLDANGDSVEMEFKNGLSE